MAVATNINIDINMLKCPISQCIFLKPVIAEDKITYEESEIIKWLNENHTSPMTRKKIGNKFIENLHIKNLVSDFLSKYPEYKEEQYIMSDLCKMEILKKTIVRAKGDIDYSNPFLIFKADLSKDKFYKLVKNDKFVKLLIDCFLAYNKTFNTQICTRLAVYIVMHGSLNSLIYLYEQEKIVPHLNTFALMELAMDYRYTYQKCRFLIGRITKIPEHELEHKLCYSLPLLLLVSSKIALDFNKIRAGVSAINLLYKINPILNNCKIEDIMKIPISNDFIINTEKKIDKIRDQAYDNNMNLIDRVAVDKKEYEPIL